MIVAIDQQRQLGRQFARQFVFKDITVHGFAQPYVGWSPSKESPGWNDMARPRSVRRASTLISQDKNGRFEDTLGVEQGVVLGTVGFYEVIGISERDSCEAVVFSANASSRPDRQAKLRTEHMYFFLYM